MNETALRDVRVCVLDMRDVPVSDVVVIGAAGERVMDDAEISPPIAEIVADSEENVNVLLKDDVPECVVLRL